MKEIMGPKTADAHAKNLIERIKFFPERMWPPRFSQIVGQKTFTPQNVNSLRKIYEKLTDKLNFKNPELFAQMKEWNALNNVRLITRAEVAKKSERELVRALKAIYRGQRDEKRRLENENGVTAKPTTPFVREAIEAMKQQDKVILRKSLR